LDTNCFVYKEKLGWGNRFDLATLESRNRIIPEGMTADEKICYDCYEITTEDDNGTLVLRSEISQLEINQKEGEDKNFDIGKCYKHIEDFTYEVLGTIQSALKKELDPEYLMQFNLLSAQCMSHFATFWNDNNNYYFECPNVTLNFKKYNEYVLGMYNETEGEPLAEDDQVWLVIVSTIFLMTMSVTRNYGILDANTIAGINMTTNQFVSKFESFLKKFKLPPRSAKPRPINKSKDSTISINEDEINKNFENYTWQDMENMVGQLFEKKGYEVVVTPATGDFGIDVEARNDKESIGIQVKHWNNDVGYEDIAKTLGSSMGKFNRSIIINSKSGFTSQAWQKQSEMPYVLDLWDSTKLKSEIKNTFFGNAETGQIGKFCIQCGAKNITKAKFCHECGQSLIISEV